MRRLFLGFVFAWLRLELMGAEPEVDPAVLTRIPPTPSAQALGTFKVKAGFSMELVAAEPLVIDPVALSFDEDGNLFVVEMRDYSERRPERLGRVRRLVDTDSDGRFDQATVFVDNLPWPTAVFCYGGGIFIGATPDVLFCQDTNGDGRADTQEVVFTGFASEYAPYRTNRLNVQAMLNSFHWGPDNRIHGATSLNGGNVSCPRHPERPPVSLRGRDFSFDPRTLQLRAESGGGQHGMSFDNVGRKFICSNSSHCQAVLYDDRYAQGQEAYQLPPPSLNIALDGPAAPVFRRSPDEPWRVLRTQWRVAGLVKGPVEGGGRPSGYFTGATGITVYRGNAWPVNYVGDVFIADCGSNLIHHKKVVERGQVEPAAQRPPDEMETEFVASTDNWFRPVQFANAPDGTLYVLDMYREVIEHPWSLPEGLKNYLDLNSGNDRGRIYRIIPEGFKQPPPPRLGQASTPELVRLLAHANGWHRDTAARLLLQRQEQSAIELLRQTITNASVPLTRLLALSALQGLQPAPDLCEKAMGDEDPAVRTRSLRLWEENIPRSSSETNAALLKRLETLAADADPHVRYQLALTLSIVAIPNRVELLTQLARRAGDDVWLQAGILNAARTNAFDLLRSLAVLNTTPATSVNPDFLQHLSRICAKGATDQKRLLTWVLELPETMLWPALLGVTEGWERQTASVLLLNEKEEGRLGRLLENVIVETNTPLVRRQQAVQILGRTRPEQAQPLLVRLLSPQSPPEIQLAAVRALARGNDEKIGRLLLERYSAFTPRLRQEVVATLLARAATAESLLQAVASNVVARADLSSTQVDFLRLHANERIRGLARQVLEPRLAHERAEVLQAALPSLHLEGNAGRGQRFYLQRCASCHRLAGQGQALGPDLESVRAQGRETILGHIINPNREVMPAYVSYEIEQADGEILLGIVQAETSGAIVLRQPNGLEKIIPRASIIRMRSQGMSAMPEGLEQGMTHQDLADLLAYLLSAKP